MTTPEETKDLVVTRVFDAPRELVYRAFVDPDQLSAWFGPVGWSCPRDTVEIDPRPGGTYRMTMVSDSDPESRTPVSATFREIVENELIVGTEVWESGPGEEPIEMHLRVELHDEGGKTRLVLRQGPYTPEVEDMARQGWESSFTKLDALLAG